MMFVINLPKATERKRQIGLEFSKVGIKDFMYIIPEYSDEPTNVNEGWTKGANSLRLTTIKLIEYAKEKDLPYIWIWEDDCIINKHNFLKFIEEVDLDSLDFDFIHLNNSGGNYFSETKGMLTKTIDGVYNCQSYIVNKKVYDKYLELLQRELPIDQSTKDLHKLRRNSYIVEPAPVQHITGRYSYIRDKIVNY